MGEGVGEVEDEDEVFGLGGSDFIITSAALNSDSCWGVLGIFMCLCSEGRFSMLDMGASVSSSSVVVSIP